MPGTRLEAQNLHKSYKFGDDAVSVLRGVDLTVESGEMVAVLGSSGAGKSTLLHILGTLDSPSQGTVIIDGIHTHQLRPTELAAFRNQTIGFVFQFHHLLPEFTAFENVMMPAWIAGDKQRTANDRAQTLLTRVGLAHRLHHRPGELSGGEQQRVAIARALMMRPRLLLADEPTGNLDTRTGQEIHNLLVELNQEYQMTMLIVTHNEDMARRLPRRLYMQDGCIVLPTLPSHEVLV